jgi:predicted RNase H-like HicB family nuclease
MIRDVKEASGWSRASGERPVPFEAMSDSLELTIRYEDAGDGWVTAQVLEVPGAISEGRGRAEARANVIDALRTVLTPDEQLAGEAPQDSEPLRLTVSG